MFTPRSLSKKSGGQTNPGKPKNSGAAIKTQVDLEFEQALIEVLLDELRYRLEYNSDQWKRKHKISRCWKTNPYQTKLKTLNDQCTPRFVAADAKALAIASSARSLEGEAKLNQDFSDSVSRVFQQSEIFLPTSSDQVSSAGHFDPIVLACYKRLVDEKSIKETAPCRRFSSVTITESELGLTSIPGHAQFDDVNSKEKRRWEVLYLRASHPLFLQTEVKPVKSSKTSLKDSIKNNIQKLYGINVSADASSVQDILSEVKKKIPSNWRYWFGSLSSEQKAVKLLLEAAENPNLSNADMFTIEKQLAGLSKEIEKRSSASEVESVKQGISDIRTAFGEMRHCKKINAFAHGSDNEHKIKTDTVTAIRIKTLEDYQRAIEELPDEEFKAVNPAKLPKTVRELQALVYFIFQCKFKTPGNGRHFPLIWTPGGGLTFDDTCPEYAGLLSILNEDFLRDSNPAFYFSVLMTSIALIFTQTLAEHDKIKMLLEKILHDPNFSRYLQAEKGQVLETADSSVFSWLINYFPGSLAVPDVQMTEQVRSALERGKMLVASKSLVSAPTEKELRGKEIEHQELLQFLGDVEPMGSQIVTDFVGAKAFKSHENTIVHSIDEIHKQYKKWKISENVVHVKALLNWFVTHIRNVSRGEEFCKVATEWSEKLTQVLPDISATRRQPSSSLVLNWLALDQAFNAIESMAGGSEEEGICEAVKNAVVSSRACRKLVERLREILPDGSVIFPNGEVTALQPYKLDNISKEHQALFFSELQECLSEHPDGCFELLATYSLCVSIRPEVIPERHRLSWEQFNAFIDALRSAVLREQSSIPNLSSFMRDVSSAPSEMKSVLRQINEIFLGVAPEATRLQVAHKKVQQIYGGATTLFEAGLSKVPTVMRPGSFYSKISPTASGTDG